jgi:hypothetical protein
MTEEMENFLRGGVTLKNVYSSLVHDIDHHGCQKKYIAILEGK